MYFSLVKIYISCKSVLLAKIPADLKTNRLWAQATDKVSNSERNSEESKGRIRGGKNTKSIAVKKGGLEKLKPRKPSQSITVPCKTTCRQERR